LAAVVSVSGVYSAFQLEANEAWVDNFQKTDKISIADREINRAMDGTNSLDIVIETLNPEDLFKPENLQKIEQLQVYVESLPNVGGTTSIVDYVKQMNRALTGGDQSEYKLPTDASLISQYFLLYSASGDPTDFEEEVDYDYRLALVRAQLNTGRFKDTQKVVEPLQTYITKTFNSKDIKASLSGRVNVDYEWLRNLIGGHFRGIILAFILVWLVSCFSFKSFYGGSLAVVPVILATLSVYAFMGITGIKLAVGTTMASAIAMGIGIDFAIHTIDRYKLLIKEKSLEPEQALPMLYPSTGRALLFNFFAVFVGFGLLGFSYVPPLANLGMIIAFAVLISFVSSMTVLPALIKHLKPTFLGFKSTEQQTSPRELTNLN
jgi:predicted RND superfamily exporter protein